MKHKVVYVHSDNGKHTAIYIDGELVDFGNADVQYYRACINIPKVLSALEIDYYDYQISNDVAVDRENELIWKPYQKLSQLRGVDRLYRIDEIRNSSREQDNTHYVKFIKNTK